MCDFDLIVLRIQTENMSDKMLKLMLLKGNSTDFTHKSLGTAIVKKKTPFNIFHWQKKR